MRYYQSRSIDQLGNVRTSGGALTERAAAATDSAADVHRRQQVRLGTQANLKRLIDVLGEKTSAWIGRDIILYYSPDVRGPNNTEGGVRLRIPAITATPATPATEAVPDYTAVLQQEKVF